MDVYQKLSLAMTRFAQKSGTVTKNDGRASHYDDQAWVQTVARSDEDLSEEEWHHYWGVNVHAIFLLYTSGAHLNSRTFHRARIGEAFRDGRRLKRIINGREATR